jgi:general secretion pathway protein F
MQFTIRFLSPGAAAVAEEPAEADSEASLRARYTAQGAVVLGISALKPTAKPRREAHFDVSWWCRELRALLRAGMTAVEAIETIAAARHDSVRDRVHARLLKALREGQTLAKAMQGTAAFPAVLIAAVTASQRTSTLGQALDDYLAYDETLARLRRQAVSAAIYPALVVALGLAITLFLLLFVIPRFSKMYVDSPAQLSAATQAVLWLSQLLGRYASAVFVGLGMGVVGLMWAVRRGWLAQAAIAIVESADVLRRQWDQFRLAKLYQSLALMIRGGYTLDEALAVGEKLGLGARLSAGVARARGEMARGRSASLAMAAAGLTELVTERLLAVGERSGGFDAVLQAVADRHAQAFATLVERATRIIEPLMLLIVALLVGGIVVMMYMPIFDMANGIGGA